MLHQPSPTLIPKSITDLLKQTWKSHEIRTGKLTLLYDSVKVFIIQPTKLEAALVMFMFSLVKELKDLIDG